MAELHPNNEQEVRKPTVMVSIDNYRIGHLIREDGDSFELHNLLGDPSQLGVDAFSRVYFRTKSGNIYQLDRSGRLISGKHSEAEKRLFAIQLDKKDLESEKITVGTSFRYGKGNTTRIVEIVPTNDTYYQPDYQDSITRGRQTTIYSDFMEMIPPQDASEAQSLERPLPEF